MKKFLLITLLSLITISSHSQKIENADVVIDMTYYKAYYCNNIKSSSYVIYKLYKAGGKVERKGMSFKQYKTIPYIHPWKRGYDKGHLLSAEDMAYSRKSMLSTFTYINVVPQTPHLNRGIWKKYENKERQISQSDSIIIICGGCDWKNLIPTKCFKIAYDLRTHKKVFSILIDNDNTCKTHDTTEDFMKEFCFEEIEKLYNRK